MNQTLHKYEIRHKLLLDNSKAILAAIEKADRDFTPEEDAVLDANRAEMEKLSGLIHEEQVRSGHFRPTCPDGAATHALIGDPSYGGGNMPSARPGNICFRNAETGAMLRALKPTDPF